MEYHFTIKILENDVDVKIKDDQILGCGTYGIVYFFNKDNITSQNKRFFCIILNEF